MSSVGKYYIHVSHSLSPKNKLEEAFQKFMESLDRTVFTDKPDFERGVQEEATRLNALFPRCTPLSEVKFWDPRGEGKVHILSNFYPVKLYIFRIDHEIVKLEQ